VGAKQAELLTALIQRGGYPWNSAFDRGAIVVPEAGPLPSVELRDGLVITLLSPTRSALASLRPLWAREIAKAGFEPGSPPLDLRYTLDPRDTTEDEEPTVTEPSHEGSGVTRQGTPVRSVNVEALANAPFTERTSKVNASSIAFLAEHEGRSLLIGGDASVSVLKTSLVRLLRARELRRLPVDLFVVPHMGSRDSVSNELLECIACDRYAISTNGAMFNMPQPEAIARLIIYGRSTPNSALTIMFNYRSPSNAVWASQEMQERYRYRAVYPKEGSAGIKVRI